MLARRCIVGTGFRVSWSSSEAEGEVRMEDGGPCERGENNPRTRVQVTLRVAMRTR
jgi:hypothetical protein